MDEIRRPHTTRDSTSRLVDVCLRSRVRPRLPQYKQRGPVGTWVLKKAMEPYLPHDVIYRPNWSIWSIPSFWSFGLRDEREVLAVQRLMAANDAGRV